MSPLKPAPVLVLLWVPVAQSLRVIQNTTAAVQNSECVDKDKSQYLGGNKHGWDCSVYTKALCVPRFDTDEFKAADACCVCGGGFYWPAADEEQEACAATCHGFTCDDWVNNGAGNTCKDLQDTYECDCSGCSCQDDIGLPGESLKDTDPVTQVYQAHEDEQVPDDHAQGHQEDPGYQANGHSQANAEDGSYQEDGSQQWVDPRNNYFSVGVGYCMGYDGWQAHWDRQPSLSPYDCATMCNSKADCYGYATDAFGCVLYTSPIDAADGDETSHGCFMKAVLHPSATSGMSPVEEATAEPSGSDKWSYPPLGGVDTERAQVFLWKDHLSSFFLQQRYEPPSYCIDSNQRCSLWADEGLCTDAERAEWMKANCRFSCAACLPKIIPSRTQSMVAMFQIPSFTLHSTVDVTVRRSKYKLMRPKIVNLATVWRVTFANTKDKVLFSIKREDTKCGNSCVWQIYKGHVKESKVVYFGVQRSSTFKFYKSEADFKSNPKDWRAEFRQIIKTREEKASYKVTVMPREDADLMLFAAYVIHKNGDFGPDAGTSDVDSHGHVIQDN